ncbi:MAG TPA: glycosyltransferase, partial [Anaerolineae bacterium]|nr:glycosyltransferase [Anaerolineae bacterium]
MLLSPKVVIVILNWNNAPDTIDCLNTVAQLDYPNYRALVVDNGSIDGSVAKIRTCHSDVEI